MKILKYILFLFVAAIAASCFENSELISPNNQNISLKKENDSVIVNLKYKQKIIINNELELSFDGVNADSRCPIDANCVWEGDGEIKFVLSNIKESKEIVLHTTLEPRVVNYSGYQIILKSLMPYPETVAPIKQEEYNAELIIKYSITERIKPVQLIEGDDDSMIKRDMLNVKDVLLNKDTLTFRVDYGGGCKEHIISLFAYKEIMKSNPAQVTVVLSHDANKDDCEALINREIKFDLSGLKDYLKKNFNIRDKAILLLFDPSGRPLRNPYVEYKFN